MEAAKKPTRAVYKVHPDGSTNLTFGVWAGEPGETAASEEYQQKIFNYFEENCNMKRSNLKEVRVVRHNPPVWYEVWVFHDENSPRQDKTFGRSVVYEYLPEKNWTNLYIIDECKSQ